MSYEIDSINELLENRQFEVDFLTALKEATPFIERHRNPYDLEAQIRISELYGVPFDDWRLTEEGRKRRYFPAKFFEKYSDSEKQLDVIHMLEQYLNWPEFRNKPEGPGWIDSQECG